VDRVVTPRHEPRVLGLIPARGGSKSLPRKNLRLLAGRPLIAHSIEAGRVSRTIERIVVSTDDEEIADVARRHGAEVPFLRPPQLAEDDTPDLPVFRHALEWFDENEGWQPEIIVQLRPTSPIRRPEDIDLAVEMLDDRPEADSVRSVAVPLENPYKMWSVADGWLTPILKSDLQEPFNMPRQRLPDVYWQTGAIDATRRRTVMELNSMTGDRIAPLIVQSLGAVDIDTEASLDLVDGMMRTARVPWMGPTSAATTGSVPSLPSHRPKLLVLDFDGVLTDNRVWVNEAGEETAVFDRGDGMGIRLLREAGVDVLVLSTEENPIVAARCRKLRLPFQQGIADKRAALMEWVSGREIDLADVAYVGNDVNDLGCLQIVGLAVAVQDSHPDVRAQAHITLTRPGGSGAVREICDLIRSFGE
jgi:YrbI family 3-deoxy-D-manno-octulosonate 8-phosphate phosphatase